MRPALFLGLDGRAEFRDEPFGDEGVGPEERGHSSILNSGGHFRKIFAVGDCDSYWILASYLRYDVSIMRNNFTTVSSKGQLVIPAEVRQKLGIKAGTRVAIEIEDTRLILEPITEAYIRSLRGSLKGPDSLVEAREREHRSEK